MDLGEITVVDLTHLLPGPYATQLLADMGAGVVKIEPLMGDAARHITITGDSEGALFDAVNRGKRSVALNLKTDGGKECLFKLVTEADVVIEQFRPGVVSRLGIDYEAVRKRNSDIVYCSLSGYGQTGSEATRVGHDLNYVAIAGLLDMTRESPDDSPVVPGFPIADMAGGLFATMSVVSALLARELGQDGGEYVDVSMTDVTLSFSQVVAAMALAGERPRAGRTALTGDLPCYDIYETADGRYITLAALESQFWEEFCAAVGREDLINFHMAEDDTVREELRGELTELFRSKSASEWEALLGDRDAMFAPVNTVEEAIDSQLTHEREMFIKGCGHDTPPRIGFPARVETGLDIQRGSPPSVGQHTEEVLREVGISQERLAELRREGAI